MLHYSMPRGWVDGSPFGRKSKEKEREEEEEEEEEEEDNLTDKVVLVA